MKTDALNGQLDPLILATVAEEPAHGYAILQRLKDRSSGAFDLAERSRSPPTRRRCAMSAAAPARAVPARPRWKSGAAWKQLPRDRW